MIDLPPEQLALVRRILARELPGVPVRAFGSRVDGTARPHADLDLAVMDAGPLPLERLFRLQDAFEESTLPIRVDVSDWHRLPQGLRAAVLERGEPIQPPADE